ncbi:universal stress protein [Salinirussus salinus]|jgi:nucleotide-binding universal stress UspA family protein|uniref:universal stress protein n=1 Tax=Salinirussus salinus TaxID=1198300 RepID=UPI00135B5661|nr:universal stress protein [Salinirussus salinus]
MFDTVVVATDGSESAERAVTVALDLAARFDAAVHALYVVDAGEVAESPPDIREELGDALRAAGEEALSFVDDHADAVTTVVREGDPATEVIDYAESVDADLVATGTRGRHGEHAFLLGSVAEAVVRRAPMPVLTVRQLADEE